MRLSILAFTVGVLLLQTRPELPAGGGWALLGGGLLLLPAVRWPVWPWRLLALCGALLCGFGWADWRAEARLAEQLADAWEGRDVELVGVIAALPQDFSAGSRFEFVVDQTLTAGAAVPGRIMLSWYQGRRDDELFERPPLRPGERWQLTVRLKRPHGNANPHGFDYEAWLLERNIRATGYVRPQPAQRLAALVWRPDYLIERARFAVREAFQARLPAEQYPWAGILVALAVGDQRAIDGGA